MLRKTIFISSVQSEFLNERKQLADYIRQDALFSQYFEPFLFEELPAQDAQDMSAQNAYLEQAANADVYLLLLWERYGCQDASGVSPTEHEYDTATAHHVYRLAFIKGVARREEKEELFKQKIDHDVIRNTIKKLSGEHSSRPVNPVLANPVYLTGYIEQMGTGTTDIIDSCLAANLKAPEFHQDEDFRTIIWRPKEFDNETDTKENVSQNDRQNDRQNLTKRQQRVLRLIGDNIYISAEEVAQKLKVSVPPIYRDLKILHISWSGPAKTGHWVFGKPEL